MNENGLYTIKDKFFEDFPDKYLKGNKEGNRPHYYSFKDKKTGLNWVIPCTTKVQRCRNIEAKDIKKYGRCDKFHFIYFGKKENVILIQDMFPITEEYIDREYEIFGKPWIIKSKKELMEIETKVKRIMKLIRNNVNYMPTRADVLKIEQELISKIGGIESNIIAEVAITESETL